MSRYRFSPSIPSTADLNRIAASSLVARFHANREVNDLVLATRSRHRLVRLEFFSEPLSVVALFSSALSEASPPSLTIHNLETGEDGPSGCSSLAVSCLLRGVRRSPFFLSSGGSAADATQLDGDEEDSTPSPSTSFTTASP
ncbi:hypothetical protein Dimus_030186 [Dionaea muscipula]